MKKQINFFTFIDKIFEKIPKNLTLFYVYYFVFKETPTSWGLVTNGYLTHFWICHSFLDKYIYNICKYIQQTPYYMVYSKGINGITGDLGFSSTPIYTQVKNKQYITQ